jgi:hypothetical protein
MKAKLAVIALGALVLMANGANAQHRTSGQTHVRHASAMGVTDGAYMNGSGDLSTSQ